MSEAVVYPAVSLPKRLQLRPELDRLYGENARLRARLAALGDPFANDANPAVPPGAGEADAERDEAAELEEQQIEEHEAEDPA